MRMHPESRSAKMQMPLGKQGSRMSGTRTAGEAAPAMLIEKAGSFYFYEPGLGLIASGDTIESAYRKFTGARAELVQQAERAEIDLRVSGVQPTYIGAVKPSDRAERIAVGRSVPLELAIFLAKTCIVLIVIGALGAFGAIKAGEAIGKAVAGLGPAAPLSLADVAHKAADIARDARNLSAEDKELLRQSVGNISRELDGVFEAWKNPTAAQPQATPAPKN